jgi:hypothetical protein
LEISYCSTDTKSDKKDIRHVSFASIPIPSEKKWVNVVKEMETNFSFKHKFPLGCKQELHSLHCGRGNIRTLSPKEKEQRK